MRQFSMHSRIISRFFTWSAIFNSSRKNSAAASSGCGRCRIFPAYIRRVFHRILSLPCNQEESCIVPETLQVLFKIIPAVRHDKMNRAFQLAVRKKALASPPLEQKEGILALFIREIIRLVLAFSITDVFIESVHYSRRAPLAEHRIQ